MQFFCAQCFARSRNFFRARRTDCNLPLQFVELTFVRNNWRGSAVACAHEYLKGADDDDVGDRKRYVRDAGGKMTWTEVRARTLWNFGCTRASQNGIAVAVTCDRKDAYTFIPTLLGR